MEISSFRVTNYKSIEDSGVVDIDPLTVIIGKNESGKSSLLSALYRANPVHDEKFDLERDWPRHKTGLQNKRAVVCEIWFNLTNSELEQIYNDIGIQLHKNTFSVKVRYDNSRYCTFNGDNYAILNNEYISNIVDSEFNDSDIKMVRIKTKIASLKKSLEKLEFEEAHKIVHMDSRYDSTNFEKINEEERKQFQQFKIISEELIAKLDDIYNLETRLDYWLLERLPKFIYMDDYSVFTGSADLNEVEQRVKNNKMEGRDKTLLTILKMAGLELTDLLKGAKSSGRGLRHINLEAAAKRLTSKTSSKWSQRKYKIELRIDGNEFHTYVKDEKSDTLIFLEERSRGFQWFFSFDLTLMNEEEFLNCIILLDEPGLYLHPDAQSDLVKNLEKYSRQNTIIYTSHLPFMVDLRNPQRIRVVEESDRGISVSGNIYSGDKQSKFVLQAALGMQGSTSYLLSQRNIVVEGLHDYWVISAFDSILIKNGKEGLNRDVLITPTNGAPEAVNISVFMIAQNLSVLTLLDGDISGRQAKEQLEKGWLNGIRDSKVKVILISEIVGMDNATIEDLLPRDIYIDEVLQEYDIGHGSPIHRDIMTIKKDLPMLKQIEGVLKKHNQKWSKGDIVRRTRDTILSDSTGRKDIVEHADKVIKALKDNYPADT